MHNSISRLHHWWCPDISGSKAAHGTYPGALSLIYCPLSLCLFSLCLFTHLFVWSLIFPAFICNTRPTTHRGVLWIAAAARRPDLMEIRKAEEVFGALGRGPLPKVCVVSAGCVVVSVSVCRHPIAVSFLLLSVLAGLPYVSAAWLCRHHRLSPAC